MSEKGLDRATQREPQASPFRSCPLLSALPRRLAGSQREEHQESAGSYTATRGQGAAGNCWKLREAGNHRKLQRTTFLADCLLTAGGYRRFAPLTIA